MPSKPPSRTPQLPGFATDFEEFAETTTSVIDPTEAPNAVQDHRSRLDSKPIQPLRASSLFEDSPVDRQPASESTSGASSRSSSELSERSSNGFPHSKPSRIGGSTPTVGGGILTPSYAERFASTSDSHHLTQRFGLKPRPRQNSLFDQPIEQVEAPISQVTVPTDSSPLSVSTSSGEKAKARDILAAIRVLNRLDAENRLATEEERQALARFGGFGAVALSLFPDPIKGTYKDASWQSLGEELKSLLSPEDYESAKRTTFNAFYTAPVVMTAMHQALDRLGIPEQATVLEPGCGTGNFLSYAKPKQHFIGVELDRTSGRIAKALHPDQDIRIENFRDTKLPDGRLDAVIGNVPFADVKLDHKGQRFSLHDYFFAKSVDALKPGGVLALVTSHYTLDKQNASIREYLAERADFIGAIRLPCDAFKREGTAVVTDIVFLRKRAPDEAAHHTETNWLKSEPLDIEGKAIPINEYFHSHPEMVLGTWTSKDSLYGGETGYSVLSNGDLSSQLREAIARLPRFETLQDATESQRDTTTCFTPPPLERHITEGSFFLSDQKAICQLIGGRAVPAQHGSTVLTATGGLMGKRLAALIQLRDEARRVLQSQNEGWPEEHREQARRKLNQTYDYFVSQYGPINKTTFGETADGTVIRRMPNLAKFREDPDAMLVMSLEEYDEVTGKATKAAILLKDVVGKTPEILQVRSAEEGLLVSLDRKGGIDLGYIAELYGQPEEKIIGELGELIYLNPESQHWETADEYLSGNVRAKLALAERAGEKFSRNAEALRVVQPPDVLPGDIDANLGAPWIPESDIQAFASELFRVDADSVKVAHLKKDALWSFEADYHTERSVAATADYGTDRANGTWLFELALNLKSPVIYDTVPGSDKDEKVINPDATLAAKEKQKIIKEKFRSWIFQDPERTERLVRTYNDTYNNLRPRLFDGGHLDFPGMNTTVQLRPHQKDAIWRGMSSGNTLLAHVVGAGKTFTMAATGMKMKQTGLVKKPMYVVPNHMLEQFAREFMQLYPNAHLLVATKEDLSRDKRKFLTAKIASGDWDGIIVTHSSFERIGMSKDYQEKFLREQIAEYDELLRDRSRSQDKPHRNLIKTIEKQKASREAKLKDLLAEDKKDDGLVFDELGVDQIFIDEAHFFKNLETPTKMDRVAGIQTGGSERAFDLFMKCRYLNEQHPGHGVEFATGTPVSNSMMEMYTMQRFLDPKGLSDRGIEHFDAWAATFGEVVDTMEISPDGQSLKPRSRFAKFTNLPELQQMFRAFADVQTAEMLNLPRPKLEGGKATIVACPMSEAQSRLQQELVQRYEQIRSQKVDPRKDNALAITTDGRKLALDARMLDAQAEDDPGSKVNALVENVVRIWRKSEVTRGTQMIFCDMGVNPTPWGYSAYEDIIQKLIRQGIPAEQIAAVGEADSDAKKQALFEKVRQGSVRVLLGSTMKMGTGTNVQKRLVALHHLDAPWKPAEVEQREGRILRQGNESEEVSIYRYVTQGSFDSYMWQALETKARFIAQVISGNCGLRKAEDIGGQELSYAEVKAIASGNPAVLTLAEADAELQRLSVLKKNHADEQYLARKHIRNLPDHIADYQRRLAAFEADRNTIQDHPNSLFVGNRPVPPRDAQAVLGQRLENLPERVSQSTRVALGRYKGLNFGMILHADYPPEVYLEGASKRTATLSREHRGPRAVLNALERLATTYDERCQKERDDLELAQSQLHDYQSRLGQEFAHEDYLAELTNLRDQLKLGLSITTPPAEGEERVSTSEIAERIKDLKSINTIEATAQRSGEQRIIIAEEPVTKRVRERMQREQELLKEEVNPSEETSLPEVSPHLSDYRTQVTQSSDTRSKELMI
ncbi:DEAD/DEAH box helicase family protein [Telmatocola sphagniphila]|uniref:DEAD/DEAH box helicase family protein n=2 Tax=Telmatocola sphagniphila TaxID=1123043 RepID=A0A8E6B9Y3_9BACT|nr:DEAD/DEAH box helicase family protein [Telmatocola sphagniphila]